MSRDIAPNGLQHSSLNTDEILGTSDAVMGVGLETQHGQAEALSVIVTSAENAADIPATVEIDGRTLPTNVVEAGGFVTTQDQPSMSRREALIAGGGAVFGASTYGLLSGSGRETTPDRGLGRKGKWRPAVAGVSIGHPKITAGTLGSPPLKTEAGRTVVLTNAHVAAPLGEAEEGDEIYQPGPYDGGEQGDDIGSLLDYAEISAKEPNISDSALVEVDADVRDDILGIGEFGGFAEPKDYYTYSKSGRTTGVMSAEMKARDVEVEVRGYFDNPFKTATFVGMDAFGPLSAPGDSGSLIGVWKNEKFYATHLLFAGSARVTIGIPLKNVFETHGNLRQPTFFESLMDDLF